MKYILMMNAPRKGWEQFMTWPPKDLQAHVGFMIKLNKKLADRGELVLAEGLDMPAQAKQVRADGNGKPVTDGVFPESKEFLAGFWIVDVESAERAYEIAAEASTAPGRDGVPMNFPLEVRQVMAGPPAEAL